MPSPDAYLALQRELTDRTGPCDECAKAQRCIAENLACSAFSVYASGGSAVRWRAAPKVPSKGHYEIMLIMRKRKVRKAA